MRWGMKIVLMISLMVWSAASFAIENGENPPRNDATVSEGGTIAPGTTTCSECERQDASYGTLHRSWETRDTNPSPDDVSSGKSQDKKGRK